ncbi:MAG: mechanosensitive ion channel [Alphaproteobacteria bacterium]
MTPPCRRVERALFILTILLSVAGASIVSLPSWAQSSGSADGNASAEGTDAKLRALLDVLKDDQARGALIDELSAMVGKADQPAEPSEAALQTSFARYVAETTQGFVASGSDLFGRIWQGVHGLGEHLGQGGLDVADLWATNTGLIGTIVVTILALILLRLMARPIFARMAKHTEDLGWAGTGLWLLGSVVIDIVLVLLAFAVGYGGAIGFFGELGRVTVNQSLYLNAFLLVELVKTLLRGVIAPGFADLRLLPIRDQTARFAYGRSASIASILGYGIMVVAPIINTQMSPAVGRSVTVLAMLIALILALTGIWRLRGLLRTEAASNNGGEDLTSQALAIIGYLWPWLATLYVIAVFVIAASRPVEVMPFVLAATGKSVLTIAGAVALVTLIGRTIRSGVPLPARLRQDLPLLGRRLNKVVPRFLQILRFVLLIAVILMVLDFWGLLNVSDWLASPGGEAFIGGLISALAIVAVAYLIWLAVMSWIEYRLSETVGPHAGARERTLLSLLGNAVTIVLAALGIMLALSELGINIGPLLAGAGVIGLAVGFGAQSLVQDIITGVFIQFENAINTGDVVTVAGVTGVVERLSVRSIGIRDVSGTYHLIPFSSVDAVANFNRGFAYHVAEIGIAYKESVTDAKEGMLEAFRRLKDSDLGSGIIADLDMQGVTALGDSAVMVRARIRTQPGQQWAIGRAYNELVKEVFDERGIEIPFPQMTVFLGTDKAGKTQIEPLLQNG